MPAKMVSLDTEAYELLKSKKRPGESFSEVVKRVAAPKRPLSDFIGIWKDMPKAELAEVKEFIKEGRRLDLKRQTRLVRRS